jgi:hypothetical protein
MSGGEFSVSFVIYALTMHSGDIAPDVGYDVRGFVNFPLSGTFSHVVVFAVNLNLQPNQISM